MSLLDENHDALDDYDIKNNVGSADGTAWNKVCGQTLNSHVIVINLKE